MGGKKERRERGRGWKEGGKNGVRKSGGREKERGRKGRREGRVEEGGRRETYSRHSPGHAPPCVEQSSKRLALFQNHILGGAPAKHINHKLGILTFMYTLLPVRVHQSATT